LLLKATNSKWYTTDLIAATSMALSVLEGHFPVASFLSAIFRICGASRGPSASAELPVYVRKERDFNVWSF